MARASIENRLRSFAADEGSLACHLPSHRAGLARRPGRRAIPSYSPAHEPATNHGRLAIVLCDGSIAVSLREFCPPVPPEIVAASLAAPAACWRGWRRLRARRLSPLAFRSP